MAGVIRNALKNGNGVSYPEFYYKVDGDFEESELRAFLERFRSELQRKEFKDFFDLEDCVDTYLKNLREMWLSENQKILQTKSG